MALQLSDGLKIRKDLVQKNKGGTLLVSKKSLIYGATFHTNNIHCNKYITVKTHARIISDGLTIRESPPPKKIRVPLFTQIIYIIINT